MYTPAGGCVGGCVTNTKRRDRGTNDFRKRLCTLCLAWSSYHTGPRTFRGKGVSFPRASSAFHGALVRQLLGYAVARSTASAVRHQHDQTDRCFLHGRAGYFSALPNWQATAVDNETGRAIAIVRAGHVRIPPLRRQLDDGAAHYPNRAPVRQVVVFAWRDQADVRHAKALHSGRLLRAVTNR